MKQKKPNSGFTKASNSIMQNTDDSQNAVFFDSNENYENILPLTKRPRTRSNSNRIALKANNQNLSIEIIEEKNADVTKKPKDIKRKNKNRVTAIEKENIEQENRTRTQIKRRREVNTNSDSIGSRVKAEKIKNEESKIVKSSSNTSIGTKEREVVDFMTQLIRNKNRNNDVIESVERSRKKTLRMMDFLPKAYTESYFDIQSPVKKKSIPYINQSPLELYSNKVPSPDKICTSTLSISDQDLERSAEISIHEYDINNKEVIKKYNSITTMTEKTNQSEIGTMTEKNTLNVATTMTDPIRKSIIITDQTILNANPGNISLNMVCQSDDDYDFKLFDPFKNLEEELDENNNLVMKHPKLKSFVVTSNLNERFGLKRNIFSENSQNVCDDLNKLKNDEFMNFDHIPETRELSEDNFNFQILSSLFRKDNSDLGLTVSHATDISFTSPLYIQESDQKDTNDIEKETFEQTDVTEHNNSKSFEDIDDKSFTAKAEKVVVKQRIVTNKDEEIEYAFSKCQDLYSKKELAWGIFCETKKSGEFLNRSKDRKALDDKTLKKMIARKFKFDDEKIELVWKMIRPNVNKLIYKYFKR